MNTIKSLKLINSKKISAEHARKLNINVMSLISKGLIKRNKKVTKHYIVPENAPRWATKFKFSRKKHGIEEDIKKTITLELTDKGHKFLKSKPKIDEEIEDKKTEDKKTEEKSEASTQGHSDFSDF